MTTDEARCAHQYRYGFCGLRQWEHPPATPEGPPHAFVPPTRGEPQTTHYEGDEHGCTEQPDPQPTADARACVCIKTIQACAIHKVGSIIGKEREQARAAGRAKGLERAAEIADQQPGCPWHASCADGEEAENGPLKLVAEAIRAEARKEKA